MDRAELENLVRTLHGDCMVLSERVLTLEEQVSAQ